MLLGSVEDRRVQGDLQMIASGMRQAGDLKPMGDEGILGVGKGGAVQRIIRNAVHTVKMKK